LQRSFPGESKCNVASKLSAAQFGLVQGIESLEVRGTNGEIDSAESKVLAARRELAGVEALANCHIARLSIKTIRQMIANEALSRRSSKVVEQGHFMM
jgi:hypothetical protein